MRRTNELSKHRDERPSTINDKNQAERPYETDETPYIHETNHGTFI